jgi:tetratricopeptide (TPR) repeat protein
MVDNGDFEKAIDLLNDVLSEDSTIKNAFIFRGISHQKLNQHTKAIEDFDRVLLNDSMNVDVHYLKAESLYSQHELNEALDNASNALAINPEHIKSILLLAKVYREQILYSKSIQTLKEALNNKIGDNYFDGWFELSEIYLLAGDTNSAKLAVAKALEIYPNDFKSLKLRSDILYARRQFDSTLLDLNIILEKKFEERENYFLKRAKIHLINEDSLLALRDLNEVIFLSSEISEAYLKRAWVRKAFYDQKGACDDLKKAKELGALIDEYAVLRFCTP